MSKIKPPTLPAGYSSRESRSSVQLQVNSVDYRGSVSDGPGLRTVLYLQGCSRHCHGCHNPTTWDHAGGATVRVDDLARGIRENTSTPRLTISGGEPLEQINGVYALSVELSDFDLALYTSYELDEIPRWLLTHLDWIKTGAFDHEQLTTTQPFVGSKNQQFFRVRDVLTP